MHDEKILEGEYQLLRWKGKEISVDDYRNAINEWWPFIESVQDWRRGRFTISITEWGNMPPIIKDLIRMYDRIVDEIRAKEKK